MLPDRAYQPPTDRLRLLERWLPLAAAANEHYRWGLDAPALERLVVGCAPALGRATSPLSAYAVLWRAQLARPAEGAR